MKHVHTPQSKTLTLVLGTFVMLLVTSYLLASIDDTYTEQEPSWIGTTVSRPFVGTKLAVLRTSATDIVVGDAHRSLEGSRLNLDVSVAGLPKPRSGSYNVYLVKQKNLSERLYIARFGDPQDIDGKPSYRLSGWGPDTWQEYDALVITDGSAVNSAIIVEGDFVDQL